MQTTSIALNTVQSTPGSATSGPKSPLNSENSEGYFEMGKECGIIIQFPHVPRCRECETEGVDLLDGLCDECILDHEIENALRVLKNRRKKLKARIGALEAQSFYVPTAAGAVM